jgi:acyl carrier protein
MSRSPSTKSRYVAHILTGGAGVRWVVLDSRFARPWRKAGGRDAANFHDEEQVYQMTAELDFGELQALAAEILRIKPERIQKNISFARDLGADSLDLLELIAAIEDKYKVKLSDQLLSSMPNVGVLWVYLEAHQPQPVD